MTRDPDLKNPSGAGSYCPTASSTNGQYLPIPAEKCLLQADDGGQYAVYKNWRVNPSDTASDQSNYCGATLASPALCTGPTSTGTNNDITEAECLQFLYDNRAG